MPTTFPFQAKALYEYTSEHIDDLHFKADQVVTVTAEEDEDWYFGEYKAADGEVVEGIFPKNFVENLAPPRPKQREPRRPKAEAEEAKAKASAASSAENLERETEQEENKLSQQTSGAFTTTPEVKSPAKPAASSTIEKPNTMASDGNDTPNNIPSSFRDRIAAFNKTQGAPIAPQTMPKPSSMKKQMPAPKHSYVPPLPPTSHNKPKSQQNMSQVTATPPVSEDVTAEEAQRLSSLKDRITKLQSSQLDPQNKKQKPVKRTSSQGSEVSMMRHGDIGPEVEPAPDLRPSIELPSDTEENVLSPVRSSETPGPFDNTHFVPDEEQLQKPLPETVTMPMEKVEEESQAEEEHEVNKDSSDEEQIDPEVARRMAIRDRMAKMSGGMGMHLGFAMPPAAHSKPSKRTTDYVEDTEEKQAPPVPVFPIMTRPSMQESTIAGYSSTGEESLKSLESPAVSTPPAARANQIPPDSRGNDKDGSAHKRPRAVPPVPPPSVPERGMLPPRSTSQEFGPKTGESERLSKLSVLRHRSN